MVTSQQMVGSQFFRSLAANAAATEHSMGGSQCMVERIVFGVAGLVLHLGASSRWNMALRCSERTVNAALCSALSYPILPFFLSQAHPIGKPPTTALVRVGHSLTTCRRCQVLEAPSFGGTVTALRDAAFATIQDAPT
jgi:hypothetical protein